MNSELASPRGTISAPADPCAAEPEPTTTACEEAAGSCAVDNNNTGPALTFDNGDQLQFAASPTSRTAVEASVGASHECAKIPAGYSNADKPAAAAGAYNHARCPGAGAPALSFQPLGFILQPCTNIPAYLATRKPVSRFEQERHLFITLPDKLRDEIETLFAAIDLVDAYVNGGLSVNKSCHQVACSISLRGSWKTFRADYDLWKRTRDWVSLVNRAKAGSAWQDRQDGLSDLFLEFCSERLGQFAREDGKRQALLSIKHQWRTGRNEHGEREPIPGYGDRPVRLKGRIVTGGYWQDWFSAIGYRILSMPRSPIPLECPGEPTGWHMSNIRRQIKARGLFTKSVQALLHEGPAAARSHLPQVRFDRNHAGPNGTPMLFLQIVEFDDVKVDFRVVDPESGQECDLWLLIARDRGTNILLGFGMRPAKTRDDGSQEHLRLRDMKQLCGWILERYGLPPYQMIWKLEHGTATLPPAARLALHELLGKIPTPQGGGECVPAIDISYSSMLGGPSPTGYQQRAVGNSKGKASLESCNRLGHTMLSHIPGQTGKSYLTRPADLAARGKETVQIWQTSQQLPEHLRKEVGYPILTLAQAREHLFRCFQLQNERTEHDLQGFEEVVEIWDGQRWTNQAVAPRVENQKSKIKIRQESPLERCARLVAPYRDQWRQISPDIITAFYEHTIRQVIVKTNGLIVDRGIEFMPPNPQPSTLNPQPGAKLLAYSHPDDPAYLHLTDGRGRIVGTWLRRSLAHDRDTLQTAIRYSQSALSAAKEVAADYATAERERLEAMRAKNAELLQANTFVEVARPQFPALKSEISNVRSPAATALASVPRTRRQTQDTRAADEALASELDAM